MTTATTTITDRLAQINITSETSGHVDRELASIADQIRPCDIEVADVERHMAGGEDLDGAIASAAFDALVRATPDWDAPRRSCARDARDGIAFGVWEG